MKQRDIEDYTQRYGPIPKDFNTRFSFLLETLKLKKPDLLKLQRSARKLLNAKWTELNFVIYFLPKATPRPRSGRNGVFYVKGAADNNKAFQEFMEKEKPNFPVITTTSTLVVDVYVPIPTSGMNKIEKILAELKLIRPISRPDWDNYGKTYSDMIQKHLLLEDSLVVDGRVRKYYSIKPRVEIQLKYMNEYDTKSNKKKVEGWTEYKTHPSDLAEKDHIV